MNWVLLVSLSVLVVLFLGHSLWTGMPETPGEWSLWLSIYGFFATYAGLIFSAWAVLEVRRLARKYVGRQRLPRLRVQLEKDIKSLLGAAESPIPELLSTGSIPRLQTTHKAILSHKVDAIAATAKRAGMKLDSFASAILAESNASPSKRSREVEGFWDAYGELESLTSEIQNFILDERKRADVQ
ncbi:MAG: hypothetical protein KF723_21410 [Rhizobiaceae bacterium]|nr:hypothetical protein [Rhizobiaceae bacterium]